jgi:hypothetical protein
MNLMTAVVETMARDDDEDDGVDNERGLAKSMARDDD